MKNKKDMKEILRKINNLPGLPSIADEALRILNNTKSSKNDVVNIVSKEQSFIAKILAVANSPIYGLRKEVSTLSFAVFILGLREIKKVLFALSFLESFKMVKDKNFDPEKFWVHSFVVGNLSRKIAMDLDIQNSGEAFIAGFLHDFSISLLHRDFKNEFDEIQQLVKDGFSYKNAELQILGLRHNDVSEIVLQAWDFPDIIIDAVIYHHKPVEAKLDKSLTAVVHFADFITNKFKIANYEWDNDFVLDESIVERLHFTSLESLNEFAETYVNYINEQIHSIRNLV
mgnify:CR=1 FL=1